MTELEFARQMRGLPMQTETHRMVLKALTVGNDCIDADLFGLCFGAVSRVPVNRIGSVTMRQMQEEYGFPIEAYVCADPPKGGAVKDDRGEGFGG